MNCGEIGVVDVVITETGRTLKDAKNIIFMEKSTEERNYLRKERDGKYEHVSPSSTAKLRRKTTFRNPSSPTGRPSLVETFLPVRNLVSNFLILPFKAKCKGTRKNSLTVSVK